MSTTTNMSSSPKIPGDRAHRQVCSPVPAMTTFSSIVASIVALGELRTG